MIVGAVQGLGFWAWLILGAALLAIEIFAPGSFILWLGIAALAVGFLAALVDLSWQAQWLLFCLLAILSVAGWWLRGRKKRERRPPSILRGRAERYVGRVFTLDEPIVDGQGRVHVDDTVWRLTGPDLPAGARVRLIRTEGPVFVVTGADDETR